MHLLWPLQIWLRPFPVILLHIFLQELFLLCMSTMLHGLCYEWVSVFWHKDTANPVLVSFRTTHPIMIKCLSVVGDWRVKQSDQMHFCLVEVVDRGYAQIFKTPFTSVFSPLVIGPINTHLIIARSKQDTRVHMEFTNLQFQFSLHFVVYICKTF